MRWYSNGTLSPTDECIASGGWYGHRAQVGGSESTGNLTSARTYTLTCSGGSGGVGAGLKESSVTVFVGPPPRVAAPAVSLSANPTSVSYNRAATLSWSSTNATSCSASGGWSGAKATRGSQSTGNLTSNKTFTLTCTGSGGSTSRSVTVSVGGAAVIYALTTSISGSGMITGSGINCPGDCSETYSSPTWVTIVAIPASGNTFDRWSSGAGSVCSGQGRICSAFISGSKTARVNFNTAVIVAPFNYSLSNSGTSEVTKTSGNAFSQNTITKTLVAGGSQSVALSLSGVPTGTSYSITNSSCSPTCNSVITFTVTPSTSAGTYPITVTGSPLNKQTSFNLVISGSPLTVTCSVTPTVAVLNDTVTWRANVSGGTPPFTYSWSGTNIPSGAASSNPLNITYSTIGRKTATVTVTDADSGQATCPTGTVQVNFDPQIEEF